ncbi:unnamed protein product, partial [Meganyctiphanes norvegica]
MSLLLFVLSLFWIFTVSPVSATPFTKPGRLCVTESSTASCANLEKFSGGVLACVQVRDRLDCLQKIVNGEAELGYFEAEDLTVAAANFGGLFYSILNEVVNDPVKAVMVQKGAKKKVINSLCHPGYNLGKYYPLFLNRPQTDTFHHETIESHLKKIKDKYTSACIPGKWTLDSRDDQKLKWLYKELCKSCSSKSCTNEKKYLGVEGSLQCVLDGTAEAAITSQLHIDKLIKNNRNEIEQLSVICPDGSLQPAINASIPCNLGTRPKPQILFLNDPEIRQRQDEYAVKFLDNLSLVNKALQLSGSTSFELKPQKQSPDTIVEKTNHVVPIEEVTETSPVRFCVHSDDEMSKCLALEWASHAYGLGVGIGCHQAENITHCQRDIYLGKADVMALDAGEVYQVKKDYGFKRLVSEVYNTMGTKETSSYYAVALIKSDSNITSFSQLKGKKSCHTGIGKTSGWLMPVAVLQEKRLISPKHCDYVSAMAEFFSGGSCAPGAKSTNYNQQGNYISELCSLCIGDNVNSHCVRSNDEPFYGYSGAFRCMAVGGGDVAFVKHTTVFENTDVTNQPLWARTLVPGHFRLLCPNGGTAPVSDYKTCSLAMVPAHEVVVQGHMSEKRQRQVKDVLLSIAEVFGKNGPGEKSFRLFATYNGSPDLIFKDSATGLKPLSEDSIKETERKKEYFMKLNDIHSCEKRVCALKGEEEDCEAMAEVLQKSGEQIKCIPARDRMDCIDKVSHGMVDLSPLPGDHLIHDPSLKIVAYMKDPSRSQEEFRYKAVTVVRKKSVTEIADIKGKKACFTGFGRTAGWKIPISILNKMEIILAPCNPLQSSVEHQIVAAHVSFNRACIPGNWTTSIDSDRALKNRYKAMCSMCASGECEEDELFSGYEGALKCLTEKGGDVAFTSLSTAQNFFQTASVYKNYYSLLCRSNKLVPIDSPEAKDCYWAARPWNVFVTSSSASTIKIQKLYWAIQHARLKGEEDLSTRKWYYTTLGISDDFTDISKASNITTMSYHKKSKMDDVTLDGICKEDPVRLCTTSEDEHSKCKELKTVLEQRDITPPINCILDEDPHPTENCMHKISTSQADVISLDGSDFYKAYSTLGLEPVLTEVYGEEKASYYAVAVVRRDSGIADLFALKGKKSCHTGINKNAGWFMPVAALREQNLLDASCDFAGTVGRFFNASCVPGAKLTAYDVHGTNPENLCQLCVGDNNKMNKCARDSREQFYSYTGAFRCLVNGGGDVAFVKHTTVLENTDGKNMDKWARNLHSGDYQLLCSNGGPKPVDHYKDCNLQQVPAHVVVSRRSNSRWKNENIRHVLLKASQLFGDKTSFFRLFGNYFDKSDLLFKNSATGLQPANIKNYESFINKKKILECTTENP